MSTPYIGEIRSIGFNFAPVDWAMCNGQILSIAQNNALFTLIGTTYGGDGQSTFALPDLRSRYPIHQGQGPGLSNFVIGETLGAESVTLTVNQMPGHNHSVNAARGAGVPKQNSPSNATWSSEVKGTPQNLPYSTLPADTTMAPSGVGIAGGSQPHDNMTPYAVVTYIIALQGIFPTQN